MSEFLIVHLAVSGKKKAIRKSAIREFVEDSIEIEDEVKSCVKIMALDNSEWIKVRDDFDYIATEMRDGK